MHQFICDANDMMQEYAKKAKEEEEEDEGTMSESDLLDMMN